MCCIILELATLVFDDWQSGIITEFRSQRIQDRKRDRKVPESVQAESDASFHNNMSVVKGWLDRLKAQNRSQQLSNVISIA